VLGQNSIGANSRPTDVFSAPWRELDAVRLQYVCDGCSPDLLIHIGERTLKAVYTFPLPLDAILLELDVQIGGRRLEGTVIERKVAERQPEDAFCEGDSAVMLEVAELGAKA
jgi:hypothetical protein